MILKNKHGITLISIVITIIILLILAGVSISTLVGNNGLIGRTLSAKNSFSESEKNESENLNLYLSYKERSRGNEFSSIYQENEISSIYQENEFSSIFQEIEYVESTGKQYIELFKKLDSETIIKSKFLITKFSDAGLFGVYSQNHDKSYGLHCESSSSYFRVGSNGSNASKKLDTIYNWTFSKDGVIYNDKKESVVTFKKAITPFTGDYNVPIFARRATNGDIVSGFFRIYNFSVLQENSVEINLTPCYRKSDGVIGMYDNIKGIFYTNSGEGEFIKGPDVVSGDGSN